MSRATQPGWIRIGVSDDTGRRSLWARVTDDAVELCSGREGDDDYVLITAAQDTYYALRGVITSAIFAVENTSTHVATKLGMR